MSHAAHVRHANGGVRCVREQRGAGARVRALPRADATPSLGPPLCLHPIWLHPNAPHPTHAHVLHSFPAAAIAHGPDYVNVQRNLALELVRVTEAAALAAGSWLGKGDKNAADQVGGPATERTTDACVRARARACVRAVSCCPAWCSVWDPCRQ